ncbi:Cytochrome b-c1 complex subunit 6, mitochondrial [Xanthoria calcicola]
MTFTDIFSELWSSLSLTEAHAEAPPADDDSDDKGEEAGEEEEKSGDGEGEDGGDDAGDDDGGEEDEEEEEEDEEEPEDIKPKLEEECAKSSQCAPLKHHYDACAERVTKQQEDEDYKGPKEDCVEECRFHHSPITLLHQLVYGPRNPPLRAQGSNVIFIVATPLTQKLCSLPPITLCHPMRSSQVIPLAEMTVDQ